MNQLSNASRRRFFKVAGGGIVVCIAFNPLRLLAQETKHPYPKDFNAYLLIGENGRVTVFSGKIEMGQGVYTSLAQMAAEELGVSLSSIDMVLGDTQSCPWDMGTFGSMSTRIFGPALRAAAAQAHLVILTLAAEKFNVPVEKLAAKNGIVSVIGDANRSISFGDLSKGAKIAQVVDQRAVLRNASQFDVMGKSPSRLDGFDKVSGAAKYAADIRLPGMLYARVLRAPMHGATISLLDTSIAEKLPGVTVIKRAGLVAVLHTDAEASMAALAQIRVEWRLLDATLDQENIFDHIIKNSTNFKQLTERGDSKAARSGARRLFEASFHKGYVAHAALEPHAALADVKDGKAIVWASTQTPFPTRDRVAKALGFDQQNVRVITPFVGGGFGGKSADGQAIEAALLSKEIGKPVQVAWTRAEEFFNDTFDPASVVKITSAMDDKGRISLWDYSVYAAGERGSDLIYDVPNVHIRSAGETHYDQSTAAASIHPFAVGPWRGPGANMNVFARESQIDILAIAAGVDPLAFRLQNLTDARMRKVLLSAAEAFGWSSSKSPKTKGFGMACNIDAGSYVATMVEVNVEPKTGKVKVVRIVCAQDMGIVVNPDGAIMQIEGGLTMGLGYVLAEELRFHGGEILDSNFDTYEIPRFSWVPRIEVVLVKNEHLAPQGAGEPAITTTGGAIANAIFDATGVRMFRLPITNERLRRAIVAEKKETGSAN